METTFKGLAERIAYGNLATFPAFSPARTCGVSEAAQDQMNHFMHGIARKVYESPASIGLPALPDGSYGDWELQNSKPELIEAMRRIIKKIDDFYLLLIQLGENGCAEGGRLLVDKTDIRLAPKTLAILESFGLKLLNTKPELVITSDEYPELAQGWQRLSTIARQSSKDPVTVFSRALFDPAHPGSQGIFRSLAEDAAAYAMLEEFFASRGYMIVENREKGVSVDWVKGYGKKEEPLKAAWAERTHGGLSVWYDCRRTRPMLYGLRVPMYREILAHFDAMDERLKGFVVAQTKHCNSCGYCTQTDKTGARPKAFVAVEHNGNFELCTMFPGFTYVWNRMDKGIAEGIMGFLMFIDRVLK